MELPNIHFQDFPIEFKQISSIDFKNQSQFNKNGFISENIIIEPNEEGYIYENLKPHLNLDIKDTTVINAPVGYGKSYAIIKTIKKIYDDFPNSLIIVASPFVSLVGQYVNDVRKDGNIPASDIYDYSNLGRNSSETYIDKRVQVVTVNTLLGNPGEDGFKNSDKKRKYLNDLIDSSNKNGTKVFFIFDEIHDAIENFKEEFIFNLWKWKDVIHKNFIISATFNEASKIVIEYLAELTEKKITIIEANRIPFPNKQSKLFLHYSSSYFFTNTTDEIVNVINDSLNRNRKIDILCYSKSLAKSIISDKVGIGKKLKERFGKLNDCTSELVSNQRTENEAPENRFSEDKCNVGTNFKSGVSIEKKKHSYIIILPSRSTRLWFRNKYGIFSTGINSIIQAIARQRTKGEIHIVLSRPDRFEMESLTHAGISESQIKEFNEWYSKVKYYDDNIEPVRYFPQNIQDLLLRDFYYDKLQPNVESEIEFINQLDRKNFTRLEYPPYEIFKLIRGEEFLANSNKFFGEDISAYVTYCAFTNQFINCRLEGITYQTTIFFEEGKVFKELSKVFQKYFGDDYYHSKISYSNFNMFYTEFRNELFENFDMKFHKIPQTEKQKKKKKWDKISSYNNKYFEIQLLRFCARLFYNRSEITNRGLKDIEYTRSDYFLDSISVARSIDLDSVNYPQNNKSKIEAYKNLDYLRNKFIENIETTNRGESYSYLPLKPLEGFISESEKSLINNTIESLTEYDELIKNDIFKFRRNFAGKTLDKKVETLYRTLLVDFFNSLDTENYRKTTINSRLRRVKAINSTKELPIEPEKTIDLLTPKNYSLQHLSNLDEGIEDYINSEKYEELIKSFNEHRQSQE